MDENKNRRRNRKWESGLDVGVEERTHATSLEASEERTWGTS
jgi:hypothetical protein